MVLPNEVVRCIKHIHIGSKATTRELYRYLSSLQPYKVESALNAFVDVAGIQSKPLLYFLRFELLTYYPSIDVMQFQHNEPWRVILAEWLSVKWQILLEGQQNNYPPSTMHKKIRESLNQSNIYHNLKEQSEAKSSEEEYLTTDEALALLKISKPTLHKLRRTGFIKEYKIGSNKLRFKKSEIIYYLEGRA